MKAIEVYYNNEKIRTAGLANEGMVNANVSLYRSMKEENKKTDQLEPQVEMDDLVISGIRFIDKRNNDHLIWTERKLSIGDMITLRIVETDTVDPPKHIGPIISSRARSFDSLSTVYTTIMIVLAILIYMDMIHVDLTKFITRSIWFLLALIIIYRCSVAFRKRQRL